MDANDGNGNTLADGDGVRVKTFLVSGTGDLSDKGDAACYREVAGILDQLPCPWHTLLGNHDGRTRARAVLVGLPWHEDGFLQYHLATAAGRFILLDSVHGRGGGVLRESRLRWLKAALDAARESGEDVYLFMHHLPFDTSIDWLYGIGMENGAELAALLKNHDNIRHLFMGHIHRPCHGSWNGIPFSTVRTTAHEVALRLGAAVHRRKPRICRRADRW